MILADYDVAPYGYNDFFDTLHFWAQRERPITVSIRLHVTVVFEFLKTACLLAS